MEDALAHYGVLGVKWGVGLPPDGLANMSDREVYGELTHHGIKGQRWGIRRTTEQLGHPRAKRKFKIAIKSPLQRSKEAYEKKNAKLDAQEESLERKEKIKAREDNIKRRKEALKNPSKNQNETKPVSPPKRKSVSEMSDEEIRAVLNRYNLEKQYKAMLSEISNKDVSKGKKKVQEMLSKAAWSVAETYTKKAMTAAVDAMLKKSRGNRGGSGGGTP